MTGKKSLWVADYLEHMIVAIRRIEAYVGGLDCAVFIESTLVQDAVIRNFLIIGEAAYKIRMVDAAFGQNHPELRLELVYGMRNALVHGYDSVNLLTIWNTIQNDLSVFNEQLKAIQLSSMRDIA